MNMESETKPKRTKLSQEERGEKINVISRELEMLKKHIITKQQLINKASATKDYQQCDKAQTETRELVRDKGQLEKQLKEFQKRDAKSKWYHKSKERKERGTSKCSKLPLPDKDAHSVDMRFIHDENHNSQSHIYSHFHNYSCCNSHCQRYNCNCNCNCKCNC